MFLEVPLSASELFGGVDVNLCGFLALLGDAVGILNFDQPLYSVPPLILSPDIQSHFRETLNRNFTPCQKNSMLTDWYTFIHHFFFF